MTWKKHFSIVNYPNVSPVSGNQSGSQATSSKFSSFLPEVYAGHPHRIQRYYQYDDMDRDADVNAALDTIADFCTQSEEQNNEPFFIKYNDDNANETEVKLLKATLTKWVKLNDFKQKLWDIFRNTIKNGDTFFLRDPETYEWLNIDHFAVELVKVDDEHGKIPDEYLIRGLDYNKQAKFATRMVDPNEYRTPLGTSNAAGARPVSVNVSASMFQTAGGGADPRQQRWGGQVADLSVVNANHVVHLSLSVGMDINWPFGQSILEPIFKVYKQKELLEDSAIIYRISRAPERRVFYIDCGAMPANKAKAHIESIKNEIHQRRIPNKNQSGGSVIDAAYNPLCLSLDTKIPLLDGRTLMLSELIDEYQSGKENWIYSCNPKTGAIVPGPITWAGITRKNTQVIRLTLDNGKSLIVTPDHKIPVLGKDFVEAKDLTTNSNIIAFDKIFLNKDENKSKAIRLEKIEWLSETIDTGTITVDGKEKWHDYHTFAVDAGIFIKNSINDDYFIATSSEGRNSKIETLPGAQNVGEIGDLVYFAQKMARGLRIPSSYLSLGAEENNNVQWQDGKLGAAMIQEFRFNKYCMRLQSRLAPVFDKEFKKYINDNGVEIEESLFELQFNPPQNFSKYRQIEVDLQQIQVYSQVAQNNKLSERFKFKRFLNLTEDEIIENEKLWAEENASKVKKVSGGSPAETDTSDTGLGAIGINPGGDLGDMDMGGEPPAEDLGGSAAPPVATGDGGEPPPSGGEGGAPF